MNITVYENNLPRDFTSFYKSAVTYFKNHGIDITFTPKKTNIELSIVGQYIRGATVDQSSDITMCCYDFAKFPVSRSYTVQLEKPLIYVLSASYDDRVGITELAIKHEIMHALVQLINKKTYVMDIMDSYYKNDPIHYTDSDSNFELQWKSIKPYLSYLPQAPVVPVVDSSLAKWHLLPSLEKKAALFLSEAKKQGYNLKITQGFRDPAYQNKLYAQGRTLPGKIVTNATGKTSKHCLGKAFDIAFVGKDPYPKKANWKAIGTIGKACGLVWGGDWKSFTDLLHFEI